MTLRLVIRLWVLWSALGVLLGTALRESAPGYREAAVAGISTLPGLVVPGPADNPFIQIFLKNSLASLTIIFLGPLLSLLELKVYTAASEKTYSLLEGLTSPFYRLAEALHPPFEELRPFFRSCYFYLYFVPLLALAANGVVLGFLFSYYPPGPFLNSLLPHGILEFPALFASVVMALDAARHLKDPISDADLEALKAGLRGPFHQGNLLKALFIQVLLLMAAYLEVLSPLS